MVVRRRRRSNKKRGGRTQHGNTKNWRGAGSRGGRGRAGSHKHKYSKYYNTFGVKIRMKPKQPNDKAINLGDLDALIPQWLEQKKCEKDSENRIVLDGKKIGVTKILSAGTTRHELVLKNISLSKKAEEKTKKGEDEFEPAEEGEEGAEEAVNEE
jgi:large subunit ribosomal protein L15